MKRFFATLIAAFALAACQVSAVAGEKFDNAVFEAQLSAGKPILVVAHAPWCPTCRAQQSALSEIYAADTYKNITYLVVDYDNQKEVLRKLNIVRQSTLIVFKDGKEVARNIGATSTSDIESILKKAL